MGRFLLRRTVAEGEVCSLSMAKGGPEVARKLAPQWPAEQPVEFLSAIPYLLTFLRPKNPALSMACAGLCTSLSMDPGIPVCLS